MTLSHRILLAVLLCACSTAGLSFAEAISGQAFQSADIQALQADEFANPGLLWVDRGAQLWQQPNPQGQSCVSCHGALEEQRGVATRFPKFDDQSGKLINLTQQIERCRTDQLNHPPSSYEAESLLALTTAINLQSKDLPFDVQVTGDAAPFFTSGMNYFYQRRGQMNLSCSQCHDQLVGQMLRGDKLSQGQSNGYPIYRLAWQGMGSLHRRLRFCNQGVRAGIHPLGSDIYVNLELYLAWRAGQLPLESPAVRR